MHEKVFLSFNVKFLKLMFTWPLSDKEITSGKYALKLIVVVVIPTILLISSLMCDFYHQVYLGLMDDITNVLENILIWSCLLVLLYTLVCFNFKRRSILNLLKMLNELNRFGAPVDQDKTEWKAGLTSKLFVLYGLVGGSIYFFMPFFFMNQCEKRKAQTKYSQHIPCGLFTHIWLPFRFDYTPVFQFVVVFSVYSCYFFTGIVVSMFTLLCGFVMHAICHIKQFKERIYNAFSETNPLLAVRDCVVYHIEIIRFCEHIDECFSSMCFVHVRVTSLALSILAFEATQLASLYECFRLSMHFVGWLSVLLLECYSGQQLIDESFSICEAIYDTNWPDADIEVQKYILLILLRSQKPLTLSTGAFGILSLEMFLSIISTAYSYFTLLASSE